MPLDIHNAPAGFTTTFPARAGIAGFAGTGWIIQTDSGATTLGTTSSPNGYDVVEHTSGDGYYTLDVTVPASAPNINGCLAWVWDSPGAAPAIISTGFDITAVPTTPPAPTGLTATGGDGKVTLAWTSQSGVDSFKIFRGLSNVITDGTWRQIGSAVGSATGYVDYSVVNGTTYYYYIQAVNGGMVSPASSIASATPMGASLSDDANLYAPGASPTAGDFLSAPYFVDFSAGDGTTGYDAT